MDAEVEQDDGAQASTGCSARPNSQSDRCVSHRAASELSSRISDCYEPPLRCCCGAVDCGLLKQNYSVLRDVERDVHMAADLGKALLARYEACVADADREREQLNARIQQLEVEKQKLEAENVRQVEENGSLLEQLEALNHSVSDSDTRIKSLEASLLSSQQTIRRLEAAAARAADAERHIVILEEEQANLQQELHNTRDKARINATRYKDAQRGFLGLQDQLDSLEEEARQERQRHAETVERLERQREIDKKLDTAAGRLKGAAVTKTLKDQTGGKIVGHFVRDLLTDNAKLQLNVVELRELLSTSNDEVQSLREQLLLHEPLGSEFDAATITTLEDELNSDCQMAESDNRLSQELHIHHHYHLAGRQDGKKNKKKRLSLPSGALTMTPSSSSPRSSFALTASPVAPASVSRATAFATPTKPPNRWAHCKTPSELSWSVPGSPNSFRRSAVFSDMDLMSSPTTSVDPASPTWKSSCGKRASGGSFRSFQSLSRSLLESTPTTPLISHTCPDDTIKEEDEGGHEDPRPEVVVQPTDCHRLPSIQSQGGSAANAQLRRHASHESIVSLARGMDIHTLKARPSQLSLRLIGGSADAVVTGITAQPTLLTPGAKRSQSTLRHHVAGMQTPPNASAAASRQSSPGPRSESSRSFGSWVAWRPWSHSSSSPNSHETGHQATPKRPEKNASRAPGINQPGAIPGFYVRKGAPAKVAAVTVDRAALQDGLQE